ncbi:MAG: Crp/Fnr family transcriptional regulator [Pseudomonadota bacterium]
METKNTLGLEEMLRCSTWAQTLTPSEMDRVISETRERQVPAGGYAIRCGEPAEHWIGVIDGLVKMSVSQADGRQSTLTGVMAGAWAGEGSLLRPGRWRFDGVAIRATRIACVPRATFERLVSTNLAFNRFLLCHINARLSMFIGLVEYDRMFGPDARVAHCLAGLFDTELNPRAGNFVKLSQEEIGLLAAISRQRANEALHALERAGLLRVEYGGVAVLDLPGLRGYAGSAGRLERPRRERLAA